jgi:hypothetical protein
VAGEASRCYPGSLERFARRMYLIEPGFVFLQDDVVAAGAVRLSWRIHVDGDAAVSLGSGGFDSVLDGARTVVRVARPEGLRFDQTTDDWNRAVTMSLDGPTSAAQLVAAILPSLPADAPVQIETPAEDAFVIEALGVSVVAAFAAAPGTLVVPGRLEAEASAVIAWRRGETTGFLAVDATRVTVDGEEVLASPVPVTTAGSSAGGRRRR